MELKQIETFLAVVHYRNMTKAAEALYITQSTASYRLKALEEELQTVLVVRKKGAQSIGLTPQGERFIEIAKEWLSVYQKTQAFCEASRVCNLRIATPESLNWLMQNTYRQIREHDEDVKLSILTGNSDQILQMLRQNQVDLIFCYLPCTENGIKCREVGETPMIVVEKPKEAGILALYLTRGSGYPKHRHAEKYGYGQSEYGKISACLVLWRLCRPYAIRQRKHAAEQYGRRGLVLPAGDRL